MRDRAFKRSEELEYLQQHGLPVPPSGAAYSINRGLWGVTIGGKETLTSGGSIPESAWVLSRDAFTRPASSARHRIAFERGRPSALDGQALNPVELIERLEQLAAPFGIGRGIHLGDTIIGTKGRVAFEAPAAEVLLTAHRELEKLVLTARQQRIKDSVAAPYGDLVHEGQLLDPVCRDIEALLQSSQARVTGEVHVLLRPGLAVHRGRRVALLADGRFQGCLRRGRRGVERDRCARLLQDCRAARRVLSPRWRARAAGAAVRRHAVRTVFVDKVASVTQACALGQELRLSSEIPAEEGVVIVAEILTNKSTYNTLELSSGRMAKVGKGDIVVGALGPRRALFGYSGHVPSALKPGDVIQMLNIGGVMGICDSATPDKGKPFDCRVLGVVLQFPYLGERIGVPARVGYRPLDFNAALETRGVPVVALAGTCMEAGKTAAAAAIVARMRHRGLTVDAFKATGVSLRRDILAFEDAGARRTMIFTDLGVVTTTSRTGPALTRTMLTELAAGKPDVIVFELGDGLLGTYGVDAILECADIRRALTGVVLSANDPVAAWGGVKLLRERFQIEPCVVTGPSTDNRVGVEIIEQQMNVAAFNALSDAAGLGDAVIDAVGLAESARVATGAAE